MCVFITLVELWPHSMDPLAIKKSSGIGPAVLRASPSSVKMRRIRHWPSDALLRMAFVVTLVAEVHFWIGMDVWEPEDPCEHRTYLDYLGPSGNWSSEELEERFIETTSNAVFTLIDFSSESPGQPRLGDEYLDWDGILRDPSTNPSSRSPTTLVINHPLVLHSMATFPPVHKMQIGFGEENSLNFCHDITLIISDAREGVTVKHVLLGILKRLDHDLYVGQLQTMLRGSFKEPVESLNEQGYSISDIMEGCGTLRELLNTCGAAWAGFQIQGIDGRTPYFMQTFTFPPSTTPTLQDDRARRPQDHEEDEV
ncbi:hypothetical protein NLI96_g3792 [Meripilus lineatus]|uniref:Uncharacterized protein n=1 Tax=Meripilus lineatus TaxID=2056292 RepID=A0AAD5V880_9APHY|nr:hypothetical protein NLI96_g3792 [Physisporinus lineatus]